GSIALIGGPRDDGWRGAAGGVARSGASWGAQGEKLLGGAGEKGGRRLWWGGGAGGGGAGAARRGPRGGRESRAGRAPGRRGLDAGAQRLELVAAGAEADRAGRARRRWIRLQRGALGRRRHGPDRRSVRVCPRGRRVDVRAHGDELDGAGRKASGRPGTAA